MSDTPSGKLKEQDLTNLDVTKLTPSSPEVISRQATINIGTIGHVAHGKSTIVKAVSGVQTVRFKNELERNITIKLDEKQKSRDTSKTSLTNKKRRSSKRKNLKSDCNASKIKIYRCNEDSLDNIDAALSCDKKCTSEYDESSVNSKDSTLVNSTFSLLLKENPELEVDASRNNGQDNCEMSKKDKINVKKNTIPDNSSSRFETDDIIDTDYQNSIMHSNEKSNDSFHSTTTIVSMGSIIVNNNDMESHSKNMASTDLGSNSISSSDYSLDTAYMTVVFSLRENVDATLNCISYNDKIKSFILKGELIEPNDSIDGYDPSEIDEIVNDVIVYGIHFYLIKWKNWSRGFNTWERFGSLSKSQKLFLDYMNTKNRYDDGRKPINGISLILSRKIISNLFHTFRTENGLSLPSILPEDLTKILNCLDLGPSKSQMQRKKSLKSFLTTMLLDSYRKTQLQDLSKWEVDINLLERTNKIKVENNMDLEGPPDLFVYTSDYIARNDIVVPNNPPIGCTCKKNCQNSKDCCNEISGYSAVYDGNKNITVPSGYPIYECNTKCKCTDQCSNRVVQLGSEVQVCIYKTREYGWGIKTRQNIQKGQFIAKYVGEIITVLESEERINNNSSSMDNMWNLDFDDPQNYKYIIDGSHYANFTYFINHSCNANLNVYAVWINCLDRNLPQLALFANRAILAGEQLTTNYFSRSSPKTLKRSGIRCLCYMKNCKGYYF